MTRRAPASVVIALLAAGLLLVVAAPARAACHIAAFVETDVEASESTGVVSLVVELQGGVGSCAGTVDVVTLDGTAVAGEDYDAVSETLTFVENDDRVETIDITILADDEADGGEVFTVELSNPTGSISATGAPATVTIVDDGPEDGDGAPEDAPTEDAPTEDAIEDAIEDEERSGLLGTVGIVLAVIAAVAIGVVAFVVLRGRGE